jgi:uncharacterized DUF497 family protein
MALIGYDPAKSARNLAERGLPFSLVERFDWETALIAVDDRREYGEVRYQALGLIDGRLHALVFTTRGSTVHVISLRKANRREQQGHEKAQACADTDDP